MTVANHGGEAVEILAAEPARSLRCHAHEFQCAEIDGLKTTRLLDNDFTLKGCRIIAMTAHAYKRQHYLISMEHSSVEETIDLPIISSTLLPMGKTHYAQSGLNRQHHHQKEPEPSALARNSRDQRRRWPEPSQPGTGDSIVTC